MRWLPGFDHGTPWPFAGDGTIHALSGQFTLRRLRAAERGITVAGSCAFSSSSRCSKLYSLNFVKGDEHMYFYMSLLVSKGEWPYRDFFFSHIRPCSSTSWARCTSLFGYSLACRKAVLALGRHGLGVYVYLLGRRLVGRSEGLLAVILFLFTFDVLRGSSHFTGANCALAFGLAASYQALVAARFLPECFLPSAPS